MEYTPYTWVDDVDYADAEKLNRIENGISEASEEINNLSKISHTHDNKAQLDKFSESVDGRILYDGRPIGSDIIDEQGNLELEGELRFKDSSSYINKHELNIVYDEDPDAGYRRMSMDLEGSDTLEFTGIKIKSNESIEAKDVADSKGSLDELRATVEEFPTPESIELIYKNKYASKNIAPIPKLEKVTRGGITFTPLYEDGELESIGVEGQTEDVNAIYDLFWLDVPMKGKYLASGGDFSARLAIYGKSRVYAFANTKVEDVYAARIVVEPNTTISEKIYIHPIIKAIDDVDTIYDVPFANNETLTNEIFSAKSKLKELHESVAFERIKDPNEDGQTILESPANVTIETANGNIELSAMRGEGEVYVEGTLASSEPTNIDIEREDVLRISSVESDVYIGAERNVDVYAEKKVDISAGEEISVVVDDEQKKVFVNIGDDKGAYISGLGLSVSGDIWDKAGTLDAVRRYVWTKQDKLKAGDNITIDPITNTISATGGGGGGGIPPKSHIDEPIIKEPTVTGTAHLQDDVKIGHYDAEGVVIPEMSGGALEVAGTTNIHGELKVRSSITADGNMSVLGAVRINGSLATRDITGNSIEANGTLRAFGDTKFYKTVYPNENNKVNLGKAGHAFKEARINNIVSDDNIKKLILASSHDALNLESLEVLNGTKLLLEENYVDITNKSPNCLGEIYISTDGIGIHFDYNNMRYSIYMDPGGYQGIILSTYEGGRQTRITMGGFGYEGRINVTAPNGFYVNGVKIG